MATVHLEDPRSEEFAGALIARCIERKISLTPEARNLLRLAAEAWLRESGFLRLRPRPGRPPLLDNGELRELGFRILDGALDEQHVTAEAQQARPVAFPQLMVALASSAVRQLRGALDKGF